MADFDLDFDLPSAAEQKGGSSAQAMVPENIKRVAQGIFCEPFRFALPYSWATSIEEDFELVHVPNAPAWLCGATNVQGVILPVFDLAAYFLPEQASAPVGRAHRLLIGGTAQADGEDAFALLFSGLPVQLRYEGLPLQADVELPNALREICVAQAKGSDGSIFYELDSVKLTQTLLAAL